MKPRLQTHAKEHIKSSFMPPPRRLLQRRCACGNHASGGKSSNENQKLANHWVEWAQNKVANLINKSWRRFHLVGHADKSRNQVVVTLERPDL